MLNPVKVSVPKYASMEYLFHVKDSEYRSISYEDYCKSSYIKLNSDGTVMVRHVIPDSDEWDARLYYRDEHGVHECKVVERFVYIHIKTVEDCGYFQVLMWDTDKQKFFTQCGVNTMDKGIISNKPLHLGVGVYENAGNNDFTFTHTPDVPCFFYSETAEWFSEYTVDGQHTEPKCNLLKIDQAKVNEVADLISEAKEILKSIHCKLVFDEAHCCLRICKTPDGYYTRTDDCGGDVIPNMFMPEVAKVDDYLHDGSDYVMRLVKKSDQENK